MLEVKRVSKEYPAPDGPIRVLSEIDSVGARRRLRLDCRAVRQREEHAPAHRGRRSSRRPPERSCSTARTRSASTTAASPPFATAASASCSRTTTCCRSAPCSRTCSCPRWSAAGTTTAERRAREPHRTGRPRRPAPPPPAGAVRRREAARRARAGAGACNRRSCLCDEPTGNLDHASADVVTNLLLELHRRHRSMLIVVTHNPDLADRMGTRYNLSDGCLQVR